MSEASSTPDQTPGRKEPRDGGRRGPERTGPQSPRTAVILRMREQGIAIKEIARRLSVTPGAVRDCLRRHAPHLLGKPPGWLETHQRAMAEVERLTREVAELRAEVATIREGRANETAVVAG